MKLRIITLITVLLSNFSLFAQSESTASSQSALSMAFEGRPFLESLFWSVLVVLLFAILVSFNVYCSAKTK